jgi:hypothetical protein
VKNFSSLHQGIAFLPVRQYDGKPMEIAPMECHVCGELFDPEGGAFCSRCGCGTCANHLRLVGFQGAEAATAEMIVCVKCVSKEEKSVKFKAKYFLENELARSIFSDD